MPEVGGQGGSGAQGQAVTGTAGHDQRNADGMIQIEIWKKYSDKMDLFVFYFGRAQ